MYPPITYKLLKSKKACKAELSLVKKHFGLKPITLSDDIAVKFATTFNVSWAAPALLNKKDCSKYNSYYFKALIIFANFDKKQRAKLKKVELSVKDTVYSDVVAFYQSAVTKEWDKFRERIALKFAQLYRKGMA